MPQNPASRSRGTRRRTRPAAAARPQAVSGRHVVYVHGICRHDPGYSDPWWDAMKPHLNGSIPDANRHEVLWSDIVNPAAPQALRPRGEARSAVENLMNPAAAPRQREITAAITDILADRAQRQMVEASLAMPGPVAEAAIRPLLTLDTFEPEALVSIPGLPCVDDFANYLLDRAIRDQVIARFNDVVAPLLRGGAIVDVISHSWGTVVAYEAMRLMDPQATLPDSSVHSFFTVGSALSIWPVKRQLLPEAIDGSRPRVAQKWVNLNARFDIVGGQLRGAPFAVDYEYLGLSPVGCSPFIPRPSCAHGSYFHPQNDPVNRDIFAAHIDS